MKKMRAEMTCEERVEFWIRAAEFWRKEVESLEKFYSEMEEEMQ